MWWREGESWLSRASPLVEQGITTAAAEVLIVVRPPRDEDDMISDEEWD